MAEMSVNGAAPVNFKDSNLKTGRAYRLKLAMQDLWTTPHLLADVYLREWVG
ncbi:hypothetical protein ACH6EH_19885 [Paenibacillus sp. JSM ZJ436]